MKTVVIKIDVDTFTGLKKGVPALLELLEDFNIKATFFVSMGPDNSGKAILNIFRQPGFLKKMIKTKAPKMYGIRTILSGTLLPAPIISEKGKEILIAIRNKGHEIGIHGWDHRLWQDHLDDLDRGMIKRQFFLANKNFEQILGEKPCFYGAPAWRINELSLSVQDELHPLFASDTRGNSPFFPLFKGKKFSTIQIPTTTYCLEELINLNKNPDDILLELKEDKLNVLPVHAEVEGGVYLNWFNKFLKKIIDKGYKFKMMSEIYYNLEKEKIQTKEVRIAPFPGRSFYVAQEVE